MKGIAMKSQKFLKLKIVGISLLCLTTSTAQAGLFGLSWGSPAKNTKGEIIEAQLPDPYADFTLLSETLFENEQLTDIPGRLVAIAENSKGETLMIPYAEFIQKDESKAPEIKVSEFNYDSYLLDTKSALSLGVPIASAQMSADYKVEYRFYRGATCRMNLRDIDRRKYTDLAKRVRADILRQNLKLNSLKVISTAATLHSSYSVLQGVKSDANITGLGWQVGGSFYASKQMAKNKVKTGVTLVSYAESLDTSSAITDNKLPVPSNASLPSNRVEFVKPESVGIEERAFESVFKLGAPVD